MSTFARRGIGAWAAASAAALALLAPAPAGAGFTVFPSAVSARMDPGSTSIRTLNVELDGEQARRFRIKVEDVVQRADGSFELQEPGNAAYSAASWIDLADRSFPGGPDRTQPIEYALRVPESAEPGDHVVSLTVEAIPRRSEGITAIEAISARVTVRVTGPVREAAVIESVAVPALTGSSPVDASVTVRNTGNVRLDFDHGNPGSLAIVDGGTVEARAPFGGVLYPGATRSFTLSWDDAPLVGRFEARAQLEVGGARPLSEAAGFWLVPWRQGGALLLVAMAAVVLLAGRAIALRRNR